MHYIVDKPWTQRIGNDRIAGYKKRDGATHKRWWETYRVWEKERLDSGESGSNVVRLVRKGVAPPLGEVSDGITDCDADRDMRAIGSLVQAFANNNKLGGLQESS